MSRGLAALSDEAYEQLTAIAPLSPSSTPRRRTNYLQVLDDAKRRVSEMASHLQDVIQATIDDGGIQASEALDGGGADGNGQNVRVSALRPEY
jgi:hypothetical protein